MAENIRLISRLCLYTVYSACRTSPHESVGVIPPFAFLFSFFWFFGTREAAPFASPKLIPRIVMGRR
jgi:hypothetical protein